MEESLAKIGMFLSARKSKGIPLDFIKVIAFMRNASASFCDTRIEGRQGVIAFLAASCFVNECFFSCRGLKKRKMRRLQLKGSGVPRARAKTLFANSEKREVLFGAAGRAENPCALGNVGSVSLFNTRPLAQFPE